jgi:hypothetical protein
MQREAAAAVRALHRTDWEARAESPRSQGIMPSQQVHSHPGSNISVIPHNPRTLRQAALVTRGLM